MLSSLLTCCWNTWSRMLCSNNIISLLTWATVLPPTMPCHYLYDFLHTLCLHISLGFPSLTASLSLSFCLILCMWMCASFVYLLFCTIQKIVIFSLRFLSLSLYLHYILLLSLFESPYIFLGSLLIVKSGNYCWCDVVVAAAALQKNYGFSYFRKRRKPSGVVWQSSTFEETAVLDEWMERDAASSSVCRSLTLTVSPTIYLPYHRLWLRKKLSLSFSFCFRKKLVYLLFFWSKNKKIWAGYLDIHNRKILKQGDSDHHTILTKIHIYNQLCISSCCRRCRLLKKMSFFPPLVDVLKMEKISLLNK